MGITKALSFLGILRSVCGLVVNVILGLVGYRENIFWIFSRSLMLTLFALESGLRASASMGRDSSQCTWCLVQPPALSFSRWKSGGHLSISLSIQVFKLLPRLDRGSVAALFLLRIMQSSRHFVSRGVLIGRR